MAEPKLSVGDSVRWTDFVQHENGSFEPIPRFGRVESIIVHHDRRNGYAKTDWWYGLESDFYGAAIYQREAKLESSTILDQLVLVSRQ